MKNSSTEPKLSDKLNIIFDSRILIQGLYKNSNRSGIYFTAYNILKQFCKINSINVILSVPPYSYNELAVYCRKYFPDENLEIIANSPDSRKNVKWA